MLCIKHPRRSISDFSHIFRLFYNRGYFFSHLKLLPSFRLLNVTLRQQSKAKLRGLFAKQRSRRRWCSLGRFCSAIPFKANKSHSSEAEYSLRLEEGGGILLGKWMHCFSITIIWSWSCLFIWRCFRVSFSLYEKCNDHCCLSQKIDFFTSTNASLRASEIQFHFGQYWKLQPREVRCQETLGSNNLIRPVS